MKLGHHIMVEGVLSAAGNLITQRIKSMDAFPVMRHHRFRRLGSSLQGFNYTRITDRLRSIVVLDKEST